MTFDDLRRIKGINANRAIYLDSTVPRYMEEAEKYVDFEMISTMEGADFAEILSVDDADRNAELIESWPAQAKLAAAGDWDALEELQATLPDWD